MITQPQKDAVKRYQAQNKEAIKLKQKKWREENKDKMKQYKQAQKDKMIRFKQWAIENNEPSNYRQWKERSCIL